MNDKKYIDAEALKQAIYERLGSGKCNYGFIARAVDSQIAADVEPIHRAHWISDGDIDHWIVSGHCSECGGDHYWVKMMPPTRCSFCGARMESEVK